MSRLEFIYLLNAMEDAAGSDDPAGQDYKGKRQAVLDRVAQLQDQCNALSAVVERQREALDQISSLCRHLRQGGPDPMDLESLNDGLVEAVTIADSMLSDDTPPSVDLALHDAELLERMAKANEPFDGWRQMLLREAARIRAEAGREGE